MSLNLPAELSNLDRYEEGSRLAGVIYFHSISEERFTGTPERNFNMFRRLCGDSALKNVVLVTNMWGEVSGNTGETRERELSNKFFKPALDKGAQMARHHNTVESAHSIIRRIVANRPVALLIQEELVDEHKSIVDTVAGEAVNRELNELVRRLRGELKIVQEEMMEALGRRDEETRQELEEEKRRLEIQMEGRRAEAEYIRQLSDLTGRPQDLQVGTSATGGAISMKARPPR